MKTVRAVFENGVFRPTEPPELAEHTVVEFEPRPLLRTPSPENLDRAYEILSRSYDGGEWDDAARHEEHRP